ncbi:MAG: pitrilysin family protein [Bacteroidales bacterium]|jgi:zinc protease|nr:insulinase family protein [Bacteroidales bacterium]MDI9593407.1 pitrilysin family protein [Bacteroidota bacterium]HOF81698.1 pitrilysin family protein [Bacteroidales bacterium]HOR77019.1 pitrilysin family protein [Bacteroidales bacterium]HPL12424.1 pitrilysin family protein [Bacteroidales bacterium]
MIHFEKFVLPNGLRVIVHTDKYTSLAAISIIYDVGSRDENPDKTGFAHLFEHLMFGGSINIPKYDEPLERAGGINNAYTTTDLTNYYLSLPVQNLEIGFWLESDRMFQLAFSEKSLETQRNVVTEEFRQTHLNQPYGDAWMLLRPLAYKVHPYRWPTIGKEISHIQNAVMEDVKAFYNTFYNPANAVMAVAGNVKVDEVQTLAEKWFSSIKNNGENKRNLPDEPKQTEPRFLEIERDVPANVLYKAWKMHKRTHPDYHSVDLLSDILGNGKSSRLYRRLVMEKGIFTDIDCFITGNFDPGLFVITGRPSKGIKIKEAEKTLMDEIDIIQNEVPDNIELQKVKNKLEARLTLSKVNVLNKAINLAFGEILGDAELINSEIDKYNAVSTDKIRDVARRIIQPEQCSTLYYLAKNKQ